MWLRFFISVLVAGAAALLIAYLLSVILRLILRRMQWVRDLENSAKTPFRVLCFILATWLAAYFTFPGHSNWWQNLDHIFAVASMLSGGWLAVSVIQFVTAQWLSRYDESELSASARRIRTQGTLLERLAIALVIVMTVGSVLMTFPAVRTVGASVLASAGIASIVAGLAAQTALSNLFAGIQLVFSQALRVDDVVVVDTIRGTVAEITFTYVVLNLFDERRLVLPCTYFTTKPFESWTRERPEISGVVECDLDWRVPVEDLREHLPAVLAKTDLWDGRTAVTEVTDATGGMVRVRFMVSAGDADDLWDLRCYVREHMVAFVQRAASESFPKQRVLVGDADVEGPPASAPGPDQRDGDGHP